jgi:4-amino-4-deoxy-L-arabinose transferase-like glycosyltransferase
MCGTTVLLYLTARRLFDGTAGLAAAALWAVTEVAIEMGAFATFDPLAIFLVSLSFWLVTGGAYGHRCGERVALGGVILALGSVVAYSYAIYIPAITAVTLVVYARRHGTRLGVWVACWLAIVGLVSTVVFLSLVHDWSGVVNTTVGRKNLYDHDQMVDMLQYLWDNDIIFPLALIVAGSALAFHRSKPGDRWLVTVLALSAFVVPAFQLFHEQTDTSLAKHVACGFWLGAVAAGAGWSELSRFVQWRHARILSAVFLLFPALYGWHAAYTAQQSWPNASRLVSSLNALHLTPGGVAYAGWLQLSMLRYYTRTPLTWTSNGLPQGSAAADRTALRAMNPEVVVLIIPGFAKTPALTTAILRGNIQLLGNAISTGLPDFIDALSHRSDYRLVAVGPYNQSYAYMAQPNEFLIWKRTDAAR